MSGMKIKRYCRYIITEHHLYESGDIVTNHDRTRFYQVQKDGSIRRIEKPEGVA